MGEWHASEYHLPSLLAIFCLLGCVIISHGRKRARAKCESPTQLDHQRVPTLEGSELYYARAPWPVYEPKFNLRLASLHGPVVRVRLRAKTFLSELLQWLNTCVCQVVPGSDTTVLINSLAGDDGTLRGLLNSCASRAPAIAAGKHLSRGRRIVLMPYGPEWTHHRKAFASLLTRDKVKSQWSEALRFEALVLVERLSVFAEASGCSSGIRLVDEISRFTASAVLQIAYARRVATPDDPILKNLEVVSKNIASAFQPGRYWVESFPLLDVFPSFVSPWKRKLNADHEFESALFTSLLEDVEQRLGTSSEARKQGEKDIIIPVKKCAAAQLMRGQALHGLDRDAIAYLAAGLFEAGTETTAMTINTFLLGAACDPEYTRRAQAELDDLMSSKHGDRKTPPSFQDLEGAQLLSAFVKEALRLTPSGASGVGHTPALAGPRSFDLRDRKGKGSQRLDVPGGATVLANIYGLHHDSEVFTNPWRFDPSRWLSPPPESGEAGCRKTLDHTHACFAFGFGKRICPGSTLACYSLTMAIALLLLYFDFNLTEEARRIYVEMRGQNDAEDLAWERLFGEEKGDVVQKERELKGVQYFQEEQGIGSVLIDAHIAFKISRAQVGECVCLVRREDGMGIRSVRDALATLQG